MSLRDLLNKQKPPAAQPAPIAPIPAIPPEARQQEVCIECGKPQINTPSGMVCENGHGGAGTVAKVVKPPEVKRSALSRLATPVRAPVSAPKTVPPSPELTKALNIIQQPGFAKIPELPTPTGPTIELTKLRQNLDYLANNIEQRELVGQVVRTIAVQLKTHPELDKFLENADYNLIIRGLRSAFAIAARAKSEKREVRAQKSEIENELADMMKDMGMKLG